MLINLYAISMQFMGMTFKGFTRLIMSLVIGGTVSFNASAANAQPTHKLTPTETTICAKLRECLDILDRHGPDEFDYNVLQDAIFKQGPAGKTALFQWLSSKNEKHVTRAQHILAKGENAYNPQEQARIAALWPRGDLDAHATLMRANLSPAVISRAIETLSHDNDDIRAQSRIIIDAAAKLKISPILPQTDYGRLASAAIAAPSPSMVTLLNIAPTQTSRPILTRILRAKDVPSVIAAYDALFTQDPKTAFQNLVSTLHSLKDTEAETALALAALLRHRHKDRADGFYLKFASDIAKDPNMSAMGRMAGFDAVMGFRGAQTDALTNTPVMVQNLKLALANYEALPIAYAENFYNTAKDNPSPWINTIWDKLTSDPYKHPQTAKAFFNHLAKLPTPLTQDIMNQAFSHKGDFGLLNLAMKTAITQKDKNRLPQIQKLRTHPISDVRAHSALAINALTKGGRLSTNKILGAIETENKSAKFCRAIPTDFSQEAKQLPFFDLASKTVHAAGPLRTYVRTATPTQKGWLVGYAAGAAGGDLQFYDNASGTGISLLETSELTNVSAILPVTPQALGQYASEFWAIISDGRSNGRAAIYRISEKENRFHLARHLQLPSPHTQIKQQANGDVFISFYHDDDKNYVPHPPLILSKNGSLRRACEPPANNVLKALP